MAVQYLREPNHPVEVPFVRSGQAVGDDTTISFNAGDFVVLDATTKSCRRFVAADTITMNQFIGVCAQRLVAGTSKVFGNSTGGVIRVNTAGVYECDTAVPLTDDYDVGEYVAWSAVQTVIPSPAGSATVALGMCVKDNPATSGKVHVRLMPRGLPLSNPLSTANV